MTRARKIQAQSPPDHPLAGELAAKLLPYCSTFSAIDRQRHVDLIARTLLEMWEKRYELEEMTP